MLVLNDINIKVELSGYGATHYRITIGDINNAEWKLLDEDYIIEFTLPNVGGEYLLSYQLKNPYSVSQILTEQIQYIEAQDVVPPSAPTGLLSSNITANSFTLSWTDSIDNVGVAGYEIYKDNVKIGDSALTTFNISGLTKLTSYSITVKAKDEIGNLSESSQALSVTTLDQAVDLPGNVIIAQAFSPSSTIVNTQDGVSIDHCFIVLYNKSSSVISLNKAKLYWRYEAYPTWNKVNLSGVIPSHKHFLIRGSKLTGVVDGTVILSDWTAAVPDLDCSVDWSQFVDPNPTDTANVSDRMVSWALQSNLFYLSSKTGSVYLSSEQDDNIPYNPFLTKDENPLYVDLLGLLGTGEVNDVAEGSPFSGSKKTSIYNRKQTDNIYQDTDNNSADFDKTNTVLLDSESVTALIKSSRT